MKQILLNLLSNAVKYNERAAASTSPPGASFSTSTIIELDRCQTAAPGNDAAGELAQLFQPFNRLGRERSALEGTGIGLVISQRLAELMGGALRARSTSGEGSSFILSLPRAEITDIASDELGDTKAASSNYHQRSVHYVEDNETNTAEADARHPCRAGPRFASTSRSPAWTGWPPSGHAGPI